MLNTIDQLLSIQAIGIGFNRLRCGKLSAHLVFCQPGVDTLNDVRLALQVRHHPLYLQEILRVIHPLVINRFIDILSGRNQPTLM